MDWGDSNVFTQFEATIRAEGLDKKANPAVLSEVSAFVKLSMLTLDHALMIVRDGLKVGHN